MLLRAAAASLLAPITTPDRGLETRHAEDPYARPLGGSGGWPVSVSGRSGGMHVVDPCLEDPCFPVALGEPGEATRRSSDRRGDPHSLLLLFRAFPPP